MSEETQKIKITSINDLAAFTAVEEVDPDASPVDVVLPPDDKIHTFKFKVGGEKLEDYVGTDKNGKLQVTVKAACQDEGKRYHGSTTTYWASTRLDRSGITTIDDLLRALTGKAGVGMNDGQKVMKLVEILQTEPLVKVEGRWEATTTTVDKDGKKVYDTFLRGMKNFPAAKVDADGKPLEYRTISDKDGVEVRTEFKIRRFLPLNS